MSNLHRPTGNRGKGIAYALVVVATWGYLPIVIQMTLTQLDPMTLVWSRFVTAALLFYPLVIWSGSARPLPRELKYWLLLALAVLGLSGNYLFYKFALLRISPGTAQVLIQMAPVTLVYASVLVFRERFAWKQMLGTLILVLGLCGFFWGRIASFSGGDNLLGVLFIVIAALTWVGYALAQKQLLATTPANQTIVWVFLGCSLVFLPFAEPSSIFQMEGVPVITLVLCCVNTLVGYGAFSAALSHWDSSRVSAILSLTPLATLAIVGLLADHLTLLKAENLDLLNYFGAVLVVVGSALTALAKSFPSSK